MTDTVTGFYKSVLTLPSVDPEMQRQILRYGTVRGDHNLLAALAARTDLLAEIDVELGLIDAAVVRVAWASRPERTEADLINLVTGEKRVKVLAALAAREDLPSAMYTAVAEHGRGAALEALFLNSVVSDDDKMEAAQRYGSNFSPTAKISNSVRALLNSQPAVADMIATRTKNFMLAAAALEACGPGSSPDAHRNAVALALPFINDLDNDGWAATMAFEAVGENIAGAFDRDEALVSEFIDISRKGAEVKASSWYASRLTSLASDMEKKKPVARPEKDYGFLARSVNDEASAEAFIESIGGQLPTAAILGTALNPVFTGAQFRRVIQASSRSWSAMRELSWALPKLTADKAAALVVTWSFFDDDMQLSRHPAPSEVLIHAALLTQDQNRIPQSLYRSKFITDEVIDHLPLTIYQNNQQGVPLQVTERLAQRVIARLGDDQALWENLNTLSSGFNGSLNDLLEVARRL